jgi:PAS domain-containing protein
MADLAQSQTRSEVRGVRAHNAHVYRHCPLYVLFVLRDQGAIGSCQLAASGAFEYVEQEHIAQLPMAVRRALNDKKLREELEEVRQALQHSQSLCRALVDNSAYGIYRCDAQGNVLDVNQALVNMLGYASKDHSSPPTNSPRYSQISATVRLSHSLPLTPRESTRSKPTGSVRTEPH